MSSTDAAAPTKSWPDTIENNAQTQPVLRRVFGYYAPVYDLKAYEAVSPGLGQRVWDIYQREETHQKGMSVIQARIDSIGSLGWYLDLAKKAGVKLRSLSPFGP